MKGFTLMEVLISLFITALLVGAITRAYTGNLEAIDVVRDQEVVYQTARVVLDLMARDLESAVAESPSGVTLEGRLGLAGAPGEAGGRPADRLDFTATSCLAWGEGAPETDLCEVGYGLDWDEITGEWALYRREQTLPDGELEGGGERAWISRDVRSLDIRYEDEGGVEHEQWDSRSGTHKGRLPRTIRLRIAVQGPSGVEAVFATRASPVARSAEGGE